MTTLDISMAGKTFLIGEYLALQGGPALVVLTQPRFRCEIRTHGTGACRGIHPQGPAGLWMRDNSHIFPQFDLDFEDPYEGQGGLGASTAQFLAVYAFQQWQQGLLFSDKEEHFLEGLWLSYRDTAWSKEGWPPSGADLLAQWQGGLSTIRTQPVVATSSTWNFPGKDFAIVRTGQKLATHEHLRLVEVHSLDTLRALAQTALAALHSGNYMSFCACINAYYGELRDRHWVTENSQALVEQISDWPEVEAVKSCGAMGADTLLILFDSSHESALRGHLAQTGLTLLAQSRDLAPGPSLKLQAGNLTLLTDGSAPEEPRGDLHV